MSSSLLFVTYYLALGVVATMALWSQLELEIEAALGEEEESDQPMLRVFVVVVFILAWPLVLYDLVRRN